MLKVNSKSEANLTVRNSEVEEVLSFTYLGANVTKEGGGTADIKNRITMFGTSFRWLDNIWKAMDISRKTKVSLFKSLVLFVLLYRCETWKLTMTEEKRIETFHIKCL